MTMVTVWEVHLEYEEGKVSLGRVVQNWNRVPREAVGPMFWRN